MSLGWHKMSDDALERTAPCCDGDRRLGNNHDKEHATRLSASGSPETYALI